MIGGEYGARFRVVNYYQAGNEGDVKSLINEFVQPVHSAAANGRDGAFHPSDPHSKLQRWESGVEANIRIPDFVMITEYGNPPRRVTAMMEVKNPWQITPTLIDQVIQNQIPPSGRYPARLALEQLYGYMVRNGKVHGVLTTLKDGVFSAEKMKAGYISRECLATSRLDKISRMAQSMRDIIPSQVSLLCKPYIISAAAEATENLPETPIDGFAGEVIFPNAGSSTTAAPTIPWLPSANGDLGLDGLAPAHDGQGHQISNQTIQILGGYDRSECFQYDGAFEYRNFQFEPWMSENSLGPKTWIATALPEHTKVVFKLWDAWKFDKEARNREASVYLHLRSLWGKYLPSLLVRSHLEYFHALIFQYIRGSPLSPSNLNSSVEEEILAAFAAIHALNVVHGDVRPSNILVPEDESKVWIIDFEDGQIYADGDEERKSQISNEMKAVREMLQKGSPRFQMK